VEEAQRKRLEKEERRKGEANARKEGGVRHCLRVRRNLIMLIVAQIDVTRPQRRQNVLNKLNVFVRRSVLDDDLYSLFVSTAYV
jgi:hypothetical protein